MTSDPDYNPEDDEIVEDEEIEDGEEHNAEFNEEVNVQVNAEFNEEVNKEVNEDDSPVTMEKKAKVPRKLRPNTRKNYRDSSDDI